MMTPLYIVDAFTDKPFAGNPAAVCPLPGPMPDDWMQSVAGEMNLSRFAARSKTIRRRRALSRCAC